MCGIVGYVGPRDSVPILLEGLGRLEYRGYDSAGLAVAGPSGIRVAKSEGKVAQLAARLPKRFKGTPGIAHTRWATHGEPSDLNAHPHTDADGTVAIVHNGIIENAEELRRLLSADGIVFRSDTDSEVLAHLIALELAAGDGDVGRAVVRALRRVQGTYGLAVLAAVEPKNLIVARNGSPVIIGVGDREMLVASDAAALVRHSDRLVHLEDGQVAVLGADSFRTLEVWPEEDPVPAEVVSPPARPGTSRSRAEAPVLAVPDAYEKGDHAHFMHKEIHDQPGAVTRCLSGRLDRRFNTAHLGGLGLEPRELAGVRRVKILGCGSAYFAGQLGALLIESLARVPADAEPASEYRYRNPVVEPDVLYVAVSQSGETFDTLAAVQEIRRKGGRVLGLVNVVGSSVARACGGGIYLHAGPEVSVTSTKTFTSTAVAFALLGLFMARLRDLGPADGARLIAGLDGLADLVTAGLEREDEAAAVAARYCGASSAFFIGRVAGYPVAREGAQKLKEVSYIHAEAYPAAELKHGPLALIGPEVPTVAVIPEDHLRDKNLSTLAEISARKGPIVTVGPGAPPSLADAHLSVSRSEPELEAILLGIPLQLLAYHAAVALGRDVDQPRNLAKSVTVE